MNEHYEKYAIDIWDSFVNEIRYNNRFMPKHELLKYISEYCQNNIIITEPEKRLYRSHIMKLDKMNKEHIGVFSDEVRKNKFYGFDSKYSGAPPNELSSSGRLNPNGISYLYTSEKIITSIVEVRPTLLDHVSVATLKTKERYQVIDFRFDPYRKSENEKEALEFLLARKFSQIIKDTKDYIETQFIAEYIKNLGYDGICFYSSLDDGGVNYTFFNKKACHIITSFPYKIDTIKIEARCTYPMGKFDYENDGRVSNEK